MNLLKPSGPSTWIVWCVNGGSPTVEHDSYDTAKREAQRLARLHAGRTFRVCVGVVEYTKTDLQERFFDLDAAPGEVLDAEIPF